MLLEVACSPDSVLSSTMRQLTGIEHSAKRCSLWNGSGKRVRLVLDQIVLLKPQHVWLSPICGPYSIMQHATQRTEEQRSALVEKRQAALKQYVGSAITDTVTKRGSMPLGNGHSHVLLGGFR